MNVFVVIGSTGEYSDRSEWLVAAYSDVSLAEQHVRLACDAARRILAEAEASENPWEVRDNAINPYDTSGHRMDYTGTAYYVAPAPLLSAIPNAAVIA